jgi:Ni/Fe-hydrogenase subunit HybB-like protein
VIITVEANNNLTDSSYELVEKIERKRMLLTVIVIACFVLAPIGIGKTTHSIIATSHEKGDWSNTDIAFTGIVFAISAILIAVGIKKYTVVKDLKSKLSQMQLLENTIYNEVLKSNMHQLE